MSILYAELSSDKNSKIMGKGGGEYVKITLRNKNMNIFDVVFRNDKDNRGFIEVMTYYDASTKVIGYCEI